MNHGVESIFRVDETVARAWPSPRVRMSPCLVVLVDQMTASAYLLQPLASSMTPAPCPRPARAPCPRPAPAPSLRTPTRAPSPCPSRRGGEASGHSGEASERDAEGRSANEGQNGFGNRGSRREPRVVACINSKRIWKPTSQGQSRLLWPARGRTTCIVQLERTPRTTSKTYTEGVPPPHVAHRQACKPSSLGEGCGAT